MAAAAVPHRFVCCVVWVASPASFSLLGSRSNFRGSSFAKAAGRVRRRKMSLMAASLRRGLRTGTRFLRSASASRRCLCSASPDAAATDAPAHNRRPMKKLFAEYDRKFDDRLKDLEQQKRDAGQDWDFVAAAFVERPQIVIEEPHPIEQSYFELREELDQKYLEPLDGVLAGQESYDVSMEEAEKLVEAQKQAEAEGKVVDPEEMRNEIYMKYAGSETGERIIEQYDLLTRPDNSRLTQADHDDDRRSLNRKLDQRYAARPAPPHHVVEICTPS